MAFDGLVGVEQQEIIGDGGGEAEEFGAVVGEVFPGPLIEMDGDGKIEAADDGEGVVGGPGVVDNHLVDERASGSENDRQLDLLVLNFLPYPVLLYSNVLRSRMILGVFCKSNGALIVAVDYRGVRSLLEWNQVLKKLS